MGLTCCPMSKPQPTAKKTNKKNGENEKENSNGTHFNINSTRVRKHWHRVSCAKLHRSISARSGKRLCFSQLVLTDANARTGKRDEGGGEADIKVLGAYGRDVLNENGKLLLGFAEDNRLALLNTFFCIPKNGVSIRSKAPAAARDKHVWIILTKRAGRRRIRCVNVRRPPLEAPELDHSLVYAKVYIPRRSVPNRRKRDSTNETPKLADLRRLMTDPNLRCQLANAMVDALPPIPDGISISGITTDVADVMLSTAAELVPCSKRPHGAQG